MIESVNRRRRRRTFFLFIVALVVAAAAAESALFLVAPLRTTGIQQSYQYDSILGVRLADSVHLFRTTDHQEEVRSNRYGSANFDDDFTGYKQLVFALGDSYTQGTGTPADQSYALQLEILLNQDTTGVYQKVYGVVNLGLAAYGARQSLLVLQRYSRLLGRPSICLYLGSDNDYDDDLMFANGDRHRHVVKGSPRWGDSVPLLTWLGNRQIFLRFKVLLAQRHQIALRRKAHEAAAPSSNTVVSPTKTPAELSWPAIQAIVRACTAQSAAVVLAWSKPPRTSGSYEWLAKKATESGIAFNDWYARVSSVTASIPSLPVNNTHSGGHYRGWVSGQIAAGFKAEIMRMKH